MDVGEKGEDDGQWKMLRTRLAAKVRRQETDLAVLGGEIEEILRISKGIYPFFPSDLSTSVDTPEDEDRQRQELEDNLQAEREKSARLSFQLEEAVNELQALRETMKNAPSHMQFAQTAAELAQVKQQNAKLAQELEAANADIKARKLGEKKVKRDIAALERNFEQLSTMYNQIVEQKSVLKSENAEYIKSLIEKDELIEQLERRAKELEEDSMATAQSLALESAVYIAGRASFPGSKLKKSGRHYVRVLENPTHARGLSLRSAAELQVVYRTRHKRKSSFDGSE